MGAMLAVSGSCTGCGADVLIVPDIDTSETVVVDAETAPNDTVELFTAGTAVVCRRRGRPGHRPVHREHTCPYTEQRRLEQLGHDTAAAYADADPGVEQAGWRAP